MLVGEDKHSENDKEGTDDTARDRQATCPEHGSCCAAHWQKETGTAKVSTRTTVNRCETRGHADAETMDGGATGGVVVVARWVV